MTETGGEETSLNGTVLYSCFVSLHHSWEFWLGLVSQGLALRRIYYKVSREYLLSEGEYTDSHFPALKVPL